MPTITLASRVVRALAVSLLCLVAACANRTTTASYPGQGFSAPSRYYPPPGPASDPWGPYVAEAASRFSIPERWIRRVMRQESGGQPGVVSSAGAMGLMQVMPGTYEILRARYGLGDDPFDPHNNMLAGAAYLKEMYNRYGSPAFLAAYNAGPGRVDSYLANGTPLPDETINYLASIAPNLGDDIAPTGPLAVYAQRGGAPTFAMATQPTPPRADGCDPDAAYDPGHACTPAPVTLATLPTPAPMAVSLPTGFCDPDAAYDPSRPCRPIPYAAPEPPPRIAAAPLAPQPRFQLAAASTAPPPHAIPYSPQPGPAGGWAIQVGAFADPALARMIAERARTTAPDLLRGASVTLPTTSPFGGNVLFRARLAALTAAQAAQSCARLTAIQQACMVVPPAGY